MARGRMIAATVADDKRFNELPIDAALVYLMAIPQLDRDGLILGEPAVLWGTVCRRRPDLLPRMSDIVAAWVSSGLVTAYQTADGDTVLHFAGFQKNQAMTHYDREAASRFPCPPGYTRTSKGLVPESVQQDSKQSADEVRTNSGPTPDEVLPNVNQCNGIEVNTNVPADAEPTVPAPAGTSLAFQFHALLEELKDAKNKSAKLRDVYVLCFGDKDVPDFGLFGKAARDVGGAGRLAQLMFEQVTDPPTGDILPYIIASEHGRKKRAAQMGGNREIAEVKFYQNGDDTYA